MRRLILQTSVSIDGYVAAVDGSHPWGEGSEDEAFKRWILDSVWAAGAHLMGRVTYEEMAAFWPTSTSEYARPMNEIPKVVFSRTLERRRTGKPLAVRAQADRSARRLHERWQALEARGKPRTIVVVAVARELAGHCWALATME